MFKKTEHQVLRIIYVVVLVLLGFVLVSPFFIPVIFGATVALALFPLQLKLEAKGLKRKRAALVLTTLFTILISLPFFFFLTKGTIAVTNQLEKFSTEEKYKDQDMQDFVRNIRHDLVGSIQKVVSKYEFASFLTPQKIDDYLKKANGFILKFFQDFASDVPILFLYLLIMVLCTYSFLKHANGVRNFFQNLFGFAPSKMDQLSQIFINDSRQVYISNIATGGVQSLIVAIGVVSLGLGEFFLVFFVTLILSFIPVIGAAPVALGFAALAFFQNNHTAAIILTFLCLLTGVIDNFLRPYLASFGESKVPPIVSFISVLGGALLLGFPGLFLGLLIASIAYDTLPLFWEELGRPTGDS